MYSNQTPTNSRRLHTQRSPSGLGPQVALQLLSGSHGSLVDSTPAKDQTHEDIAPAEAEEMRKRRARLARHFKDKYEIEPFDNFLGNIGELDTYNDFVKSAQNLFQDVAQAAPAIYMKKMIATKGMEGNELAKTFVSEKTGEDALMEYFFVLCDKMAEKASKAAEHNIPQNN
ncbi:hypothetical protein IWW48_003438 [Coemansia sp. RSA 1200]|nr:hypothetical protein IWW48_003438 [Coemansia sp. RSA 1200]